MGTPGARRCTSSTRSTCCRQRRPALLKTLEEPPPRGVRAGRPTRRRCCRPSAAAPSTSRVRLPVERGAGRAGRVHHRRRRLDVPPARSTTWCGPGPARPRRGVRARSGRAPAGCRRRPSTRRAEALCERDTGRALIAVDAAISAGRVPGAGRAADRPARDVFLASMKADLSRLPDRDRGRVTDQAACRPAGASALLGRGVRRHPGRARQRIPLEVALVRLTRPDADTSLAALADHLRLERAHPRQALPAPRRPRRRRGTGAATPAGRAGAEPEPIPGRRAADDDEARARRSSGRSTVRRGVRCCRPSGRSGPVAVDGRRPISPRREPATAVHDGPRARRGAGSTPAAPNRCRRTRRGRRCTRTTPRLRLRRGWGVRVALRDELTLAWGDTILASLPPRAKAFCAAGRFLEVTDKTAVFGLPNAPHAAVRERPGRCRGRAGSTPAGPSRAPWPSTTVAPPPSPAAPAETPPPPGRQRSRRRRGRPVRAGRRHRRGRHLGRPGQGAVPRRRARRPVVSGPAVGRSPTAASTPYPESR